MSAFQTEFNYFLVSGNAPATGVGMVVTKASAFTVFYNFNGLGTGSNAFMSIEVADPTSGWCGYYIDTVSPAGSGIQTSISSFSTPLFALRGVITGVNSGNCSIYIIGGH